MTLMLVALNVPTVSAKPQGSWEAVKTSVNQAVAVETKTGAAIFGILRVANDNEIKIQIAGKKELNDREMTVQRGEVKKIRQAELRYGESRVGTGALIGAAGGAGIGVITVLSDNTNDGQVALAIPVYALYGAGIGALIGLFSKKTHRKGKIIYSE